jgi:hypothetical protein
LKKLYITAIDPQNYFLNPDDTWKELYESYPHLKWFSTVRILQDSSLSLYRVSKNMPASLTSMDIDLHHHHFLYTQKIPSWSAGLTHLTLKNVVENPRLNDLFPRTLESLDIRRFQFRNSFSDYDLACFRNFPHLKRVRLGEINLADVEVSYTAPFLHIFDVNVPIEWLQTSSIVTGPLPPSLRTLQLDHTCIEVLQLPPRLERLILRSSSELLFDGELPSALIALDFNEITELQLESIDAWTSTGGLLPASLKYIRFSESLIYNQNVCKMITTRWNPLAVEMICVITETQEEIIYTNKQDLDALCNRFLTCHKRKLFLPRKVRKKKQPRLQIV